jgi:hypothetical protein
MTLTDQFRAKARELEKVISSLAQAVTSLKAAADNLEAIESLGEVQKSAVNLPNVSPSAVSPFPLQVEQVPPFTLERNGSAKDYSTLSGIELIALILKEAGDAMTLGDIGAKLKEYGRSLGDNTVQSYLSRTPHFQNVGRGLWKLKPDISNIESKEEQSMPKT